MLTHAYCAQAVVIRKLTQRQRDLLIVGSILPDVSELKIADETRTHTEGKKFFHFVSNEYKFLALGVMLHGHAPKGVDYYTHNGFYGLGDHYTKLPPRLGKTAGYIAHKYKELEPILKHYKKSLGKTSFHDAAHFVVEFCSDHLVARKNPELGERVRTALKNSISNHALLNFANYYSINRKKLKKMQNITQFYFWKKVFKRFQTVEGTAHNMQQFLFIKSVREKHTATKRPKFFSFIQQFGRSSLGLLQTKIFDKRLVEMVERCMEIIRKDHDQFLNGIIKEMKVMVRKEKLV
jgi:hypothetical protein